MRLFAFQQRPRLARFRLAAMGMLTLAFESRWSHAQHDPAPGQPASAVAPAKAGASRVSIGGDLAASYLSEVGSTSAILAPLLEASFAMHRRVLLDMAWGAAWMIDNQGLGESTGRVGNPMLSGFYRWDEGAWRLRVGLGVTAPLAHFPLGYDGRLHQFVYNQTLAMWGMWNQWLWLPDRMAIPATGWFGYVLPNGQVLIAEAALAPVIGARGSASGVDLAGQIALEVRLATAYGFALHPRLQAVVLPTTSMDRFQSAAGLRISFETSLGRFFAGTLINLDPTLGVFGGLQRWGFHVGKEVDL